MRSEDPFVQLVSTWIGLECHGLKDGGQSSWHEWSEQLTPGQVATEERKCQFWVQQNGIMLSKINLDSWVMRPLRHMEEWEWLMLERQNMSIPNPEKGPAQSGPKPLAKPQHITEAHPKNQLSLLTTGSALFPWYQDSDTMTFSWIELPWHQDSSHLAWGYQCMVQVIQWISFNATWRTTWIAGVNILQ